MGMTIYKQTQISEFKLKSNLKSYDEDNLFQTVRSKEFSLLHIYGKNEQWTTGFHSSFETIFPLLEVEEPVLSCTKKQQYMREKVCF